MRRVLRRTLRSEFPRIPAWVWGDSIPLEGVLAAGEALGDAEAVAWAEDLVVRWAHGADGADGARHGADGADGEQRREPGGAGPGAPPGWRAGGACGCRARALLGSSRRSSPACAGAGGGGQGGGLSGGRVVGSTRV